MVASLRSSQLRGSDERSLVTTTPTSCALRPCTAASVLFDGVARGHGGGIRELQASLRHRTRRPYAFVARLLANDLTWCVGVQARKLQKGGEGEEEGRRGTYGKWNQGGRPTVGQAYSAGRRSAVRSGRETAPAKNGTEEESAVNATCPRARRGRLGDEADERNWPDPLRSR